MIKSFISLVPDPPSGFTYLTPCKRDLLSSPVAIYAKCQPDAYSLIENFSQRVNGLLIIPAKKFNSSQIGPNLWLLQVPKKITGNLHSIASCFLEIFIHSQQYLDDYKSTNIELARSKKIQKQAWENYNLNLERLVRKIEDLRNEISRRKKTEKALRESEENLRTTLNSIGDAVIATDISGAVIRMNKVAQKITGWKLSEAYGHPLTEIFKIINSKTRKSIRNPVEKVINRKKVVGLSDHTILVAKDGKEYQISDSAAPIKDDQDKITGVVMVFRDVSEEYKIREKVRELATIAEQAIEGIMMVDLQGKLLYCNQAWAQLHGYENPAELINQDPRLFHTSAQYDEEVIPFVENVLKHGYWVGEVGHVRNDGSTFIAKMSSNLLKDKNGKPYAVATFAQDITESKQAEKALTHRIEFEKLVSRILSELASVSSESIDPVIDSSLASLGKFINADRINIFQFNHNFTSMDNTYEWCREGIERHRDKLQDINLNNFQRFMEKLSNFKNLYFPNISEISSQPHFKMWKKYHQNIKSLVMVPMESSGKLTGFLGVETINNYMTWSEDDQNLLRFVAETFIHAIERNKVDKKLRESEQRFRELTELLPETIIEVNQDLKITYANQKMFNLFGYSHQDFKQGLSWIDMVISEQQELVVSNNLRRLRGEKIGAIEYTAKRKNGSTFPMLYHANVIQNEKQITGLRGIIIDLTEHKRVEQEQLKLQKLESIGMLAGGIAHDFNNLLSGLFGNIEMAKMFLEPGHKSYEFLDIANKSMEIATNLTNQLLTFAKGGEPVKETLSMGDILIESAQFSLRGSNIKLETNIAADLWTVEADKGQMSQVVSNLIINAQQSMPTGGIITLEACNVTTSRGREVKITVKDQGVGILPKHLDKIFDPYFTTKQHGSGLGMTITYSIISKHKGTINVDSEINSGTTITIFLPTSKTPSTNTVLTDSEGDLKHSIDRANILLLDDEELVIEVLGSMLEMMGHKVSYASNGKEAVDKYEQSLSTNEFFDLVITDLTIPGEMGGKEVAEKILALHPPAKIILSSGYATDPIIANYQDYGFKSRLVKPFNFDDLKQVIGKVLKSE
ncbi:MAG: hypothetical protein APR63_12735 [Desulfuromonas sp. SDB]|nr:MAG: hypothetical protein APR63_12735 [Desulfuromonas sp. SDB]